jgi:hydrogenase expression/formation protein HypE
MAYLVDGKVPHRVLSDLLSRLSPAGREVVVGPAPGEDACAIDTGGDLLVASSDPITFTRRHVGYYSVNVNANDVATMGARPRWFVAVLLMPPGVGKKRLTGIFDEVDRTCAALGISVCGGHTEITSQVKQPVIVGTMLGTVSRRHLVRPARARAGDRVLLTKGLAIEGTAIIAGERRREVEKVLGRRGAARARRLLFSPGISVVGEALCAVETAPVHAMHDPTEGGLLRGLKELAEVARLGIEVDLDSVPVFEETRAVCEHFGLNPLGLIASGSLLIVVSRRNAHKVARAVAGLGIGCAEVGRMIGKGLRGVRRGRPVRLPRFEGDEIAKVL